MAKSNTTDQGAPATPTPEPTAPSQTVHYQQPVYAPRPQKNATYPGMELALGVFSVLASAWLLVEAIAAMIALFGGGRAPAFDSLVGLLFTHLNMYTGTIIVSLGAVAFAGTAFWLLRRSAPALADGKYKAALHVGAGVAGVKTIALAVTTFAAGLTPLLTIQRGSNVGPAYLYDFLPLLLGVGVFGFVAWAMLKLVGRQRVASMLTTALLIASSLIFVLAFVAVIVRSHSSGSTSVDTSSSSSSSGGSLSECISEYNETDDRSDYLACIRNLD